MRLRSLTVEGHTSIRHAQVELGDINVLVGANGAGKSNLIRALELLGRIVDRDLQYYVRLSGGASLLLHQPGGRSLRLAVNADSNGYEAELEATADDSLVFGHEQISFQASGNDQPYIEPLGRGGQESLAEEPDRWQTTTRGRVSHRATTALSRRGPDRGGSGS